MKVQIGNTQVTIWYFMASTCLMLIGFFSYPYFVHFMLAQIDTGFTAITTSSMSAQFNQQLYFGVVLALLPWFLFWVERLLSRGRRETGVKLITTFCLLLGITGVLVSRLVYLQNKFSKEEWEEFGFSRMPVMDAYSTEELDFPLYILLGAFLGAVVAWSIGFIRIRKNR